MTTEDPTDNNDTPQTAEQAMRAFIKALFRGDPEDDATFRTPTPKDAR